MFCSAAIKYVHLFRSPTAFFRRFPCKRLKPPANDVTVMSHNKLLQSIGCTLTGHTYGNPFQHTPNFEIVKILNMEALYRLKEL